MLHRLATTASLLLGLLALPALAAPLTVHYAGRLTNGNGAPRHGAVDLEARFFRGASGGNPVGSTQRFSAVELQDGVFDLALSFPPTDFHALFADSTEVWIELTELATGTPLPRQRLNAAPQAYRVPIDNTTLAFDSDGKLTVTHITASQVDGLTTTLSSKADTSDITSQLASKADAGAMTTALAGKAATAHAHTLSGDVSGDLNATTVAKLQGSAVASTAPSTAGQVLKWDGSQWYPGPDDGGVAGAISNGANLGTGANVFKSVAAPNMEFRSLSAGSNVNLTTNANDIAIATTPTLTSSAAAGVVVGPYGVGAGSTGELRFQELAAGGNNYVAFKSPDALATDVSYTLPNAAPVSDGQVLSGTTAGTLAWSALPAALPPNGSAGGGLSGSYPNPDLAAGAVTSTKLAADAVTSAKIQDGQVATADLAANAVTTAKLAADAVTSAQIQDGQVGTADLAASAVTTTEIADAAVSSAKIADGTVVNADLSAAAAIARSKLANGTASHVLINDGAGTVSSEAQLATSRGGTGVSSTATFPGSGVVVTEAATETLSNKTLGASNTLTGATAASFSNGAATVTLPTATGTLATLAGTETLTNKTLTSPTINGGTMAVGLGAVGAPSYAFTGDVDTGVWSSGADTWNLSTAGSERIRVTSAGEVGIGTTNPARMLHVYADQDTGTKAAVTNPNTGVAAMAQLSVEAASATGYLYSFGSGYATSGRYIGGSTLLEGNGAGGLGLSAANATGALRFYTGAAGAERLRIDSAGNVGIGTTSPAGRLHVSGGGNLLHLENSNTGNSSFGWANTSNYISHAATGQTVLRRFNGGVSYTDQMVVDGATGNVGIGTASPGQKLTVNGTIESLTGGIKFPDGTVQTTSANTGTNNTMVSGWPDAIACAIGAQFNILFLNAVPWSTYGALYRMISNTAGDYFIFYNTDGTFAGQSNLAASDCVTGSWSIATVIGNGRSFNFAKGPAAQWLQTGGNAYYNAGNVGIGTASPNAKLAVNGAVTVNGASPTAQLHATAGTGTTTIMGTNTGTSYGVYCNASNCGGASAWVNTSDVRLKTSIQPLEHALPKILDLQGVSYHWRDEARDEREGEKIGFIAQDVEAIFPQAVKTDTSSPGHLPGGTKSIAYSDLIAPIVEAIKELFGHWSTDHARIDDLEQENANLRTQVSRHETDIATLRHELETLRVPTRDASGEEGSE